MYKILALNCLITAYSLSVQYLDGIKFGDYQVTITGMLMSVCFLCISRAKVRHLPFLLCSARTEAYISSLLGHAQPVEKLSRERPLGNILNFYVLLSVLLQFAIHIAALLYMTILAKNTEECVPLTPFSICLLRLTNVVLLSPALHSRGPIDLEAKFAPSLLNTAIYLLGLSQQVSTFAINFQGRPFREGISENPPLYWGLMGVAAVAYSGSTDFFPEGNRWLQLVEMTRGVRLLLPRPLGLP